MSSKYWFKRRRYGLGWIPVTWQGWLTVVVFLVIVIGGAFLLPPKNSKNASAAVVLYILAVLAALNFFIAISLRKGPVPKWRWGKKPTDNQNKDF